MPILLEAMERHGHVQLVPEVRARLLAMSAATIDRALRDIRQQAGTATRRRSAPSAAIRRSVPVRTFADWDDPPPGFVEADLVAHSGPVARGSFVQTLVLTDIATGWTECAPLLVREQRLLTEVLGEIRKLLPFSGEPPDPGRNGERDFHGERRRNDTHGSTTDPETRLFRKGPGKEARLCFMGHALMENRNGLIVGAVTTRASGHAERLAALTLIEPHAERPQPVTLGADKGYDAGEFVMELRDKAVTPHVAQNTSARRSAIDGRTTRHPGYAISQRIRKRVEEVFGWAKTVAGLRKVRHRGLLKVGWQFTLAMAAYDLVRLPNCSLRLSHDPVPYDTAHQGLLAPNSTCRKTRTAPLCRSSRNPERAEIGNFSAPC